MYTYPHCHIPTLYCMRYAFRLQTIFQHEHFAPLLLQLPYAVCRNDLGGSSFATLLVSWRLNPGWLYRRVTRLQEILLQIKDTSPVARGSQRNHLDICVFKRGTRIPELRVTTAQAAWSNAFLM